MIRLTALILAGAFQASLAFAAPADLTRLASRADLEAAIGATTNASLKSALKESTPAILAALEQRPHVEAVTRTVESAHGKVEKINTTPESLKKAAGGDLPVFDTLKLVDLAVPNTGPHDQRKFDPYDAAFFEHLGHLSALESLNVISTKLGDEGLDSIGRLTGLKSLRFTNNGKLTDAGLAKLAGLKELDSFSFVGTGMQGHAFAQFDGWTHLAKCSFRGSSIDDEGLRNICEKFPNLESISLAHAKFTDAGAPALAKLTKLESLELGTHNATAAALAPLASLSLENLKVGEGFALPESIAHLQKLTTLKRLTLTDCAKMTDDDLKQVSAMHQLESLELGNLPLPAERASALAAFTFLKTFRLVQRPQPYAAEIQEKLKQLLPKTQLVFQ